MNEQNFENSDNVDRTKKDIKGSIINSVYATLISENPMDESVASVGTIEGKIIQDVPMVDQTPYDIQATHQPSIGTNAPLSVDLLNGEESEQLCTRWNEIQGKFVDEPRSAVQQADALVSDVTEKITQMFTDEHSTLESQWKQGNDVSTEDLRKALQRYRFFFNRLVA